MERWTSVRISHRRSYGRDHCRSRPFLSCNQTLIISGYSGVALSESVSGVIADGGQASGRGGSLTMASSEDTLILTGNNTYTGATTVNAGTLILSGMSSSSSFAIGANGTLDLASGYFSIPGSIVNNGTLVLGNESP